MTDQETLIACRRQQAQETLADARLLLQGNASPRSVVNRAYYAAFYTVLALLLRRKQPIATSRHSGIISLFDTALVHPGLVASDYSTDLHRLFVWRLKGDYRETSDLTRDRAVEAVTIAERFCSLLDNQS